jgi:rubrerythrin
MYDENYSEALKNKPYPDKKPDNENFMPNASENPSDNIGYSGGYADKQQQSVINDYIKKLLTEAMRDEKADSDYYSRLANMGISNDDNKLIYSISLDEKNHFKMLSQIYRELFGEPVPDIAFEQKEVLDTPSLNFEKSILSELEGAEFYKPIMFSFLNTKIRDMIYDIITDEQGHAQKMNYLYSKYN